MSRKTLLLVNADKPEAIAGASQVRSLIQRFGRLVGEYAATDEALPRFEEAPELVVVLGGDGTILAQSRRCLEMDVPILGVNFGRVGFMAEFDIPSMTAQAEHLFGSEPLRTHSSGLIQTEILRKHNSPAAPSPTVAINEVVVTAGPPYKMIQLALTLNGRSGPVMSGDGLIVATPLGSTAYTLSAGGPIVSPMVDAWAITPIAAFSLAFRPIVVASQGSLEIEVTRANGEDRADGTTLVIDGHAHARLESGDRVLLTRHQREIRFVNNTQTDYWARLIGKLGWAALPRSKSQ